MTNVLADTPPPPQTDSVKPKALLVCGAIAGPFLS